MTATNKKRGLTAHHRARATGSTLMGRRVSSSYVRSNGLAGGVTRTLRDMELSRPSACPASNHSISDRTTKVDFSVGASFADSRLLDLPWSSVTTYLSEPISSFRQYGNGFKTHPKTQHARHLDNGREARIAISGKCSVEERPRKSSFTCHLSHALRASHHAQRAGEQSQIVSSEAMLQMDGQLIIGYPPKGGLVFHCFDLTHSNHLGDTPPYIRPAREASQARVGEDAYLWNVVQMTHIIHSVEPLSTHTCIAKRPHCRYGSPIAHMATGFGHSDKSRRNSSAQETIAGAFFTSAKSFYGGCAWGTFECAGFLDSRLTNPRTAATYSFGHERGGSSYQGAPPMQEHIHRLIPSKIRALAHRRMALSALHADSSLYVRLKRYNHHMAIVRTLEDVGGAA